MVKAKVYTMNGQQTQTGAVDKLRSIATQLQVRQPANPLIVALFEAIDDVERSLKATVPISRGSRPVGYGVDGSLKNIACDHAIAVLREIKREKAW